jgi:pimeloyl-ACP methyl ester carboxylesterase
MAMFDFPAVYLLHGMGASPEGSVKQLETEMRRCGQQKNFVCPLMPHTDPAVSPSVSVQYLASLNLPQGALVVGISMGGLVAAKLQELERTDLHVICINSPTWAGDTDLLRQMNHRLSLYCSGDEIIAGRTERWPQLAEAYDLPWLSGHDTDKHKRALAIIIGAYMEGLSIPELMESLNESD